MWVFRFSCVFRRHTPLFKQNRFVDFCLPPLPVITRLTTDYYVSY
ncbi:hypothetical protein CORMATOL_03127 [Corynebacterium matruchotii ATCC 33806]|uniref:Uncharacterized protein n=1 Tax=Corynebacterium matruchotii ATCC 33806 TaxID=566549 RepID=C0E7Y6_9CORY|nr:hypothetical protein CORMATOL_03127 [Corynebacterium matruchotii ATCC 33806]